MPDPSSRARDYGEKADECLRLAGMTPELTTAAEYRKLANAYLDLRQFELALIRRRAGKNSTEAPSGTGPDVARYPGDRAGSISIPPRFARSP